MNILEFVAENPWTSMALFYMGAHFVFMLWNRFMRMLNIRKAGWPPPHCDADGDLRDDDGPENTEVQGR